MIITAASALVIVETTFAAYGSGIATDAALGLAATLIDNFALKGFDQIKEAIQKRKDDAK